METPSALEKSFDKTLRSEIEAIIDRVVKEQCDNQTYDPKFGQQWSNTIAERIVQEA